MSRLPRPAFLLLVLACNDSNAPHSVPKVPTAPAAIHKIQHVVVIMQENRSFDSYFGTFPGRRGHPHAERSSRRRACRTPSWAGASRLFTTRRT